MSINDNNLETQTLLRDKYCNGCEDDFYNNKNPLNITRCWSLSSAGVVMKKQVGMNDVPPWNHTPIETLSCFHRRGYVMVSADKTC